MTISRLMLVATLCTSAVGLAACDKVADAPPPQDSATPPPPRGPGMFGQRNRFRQPASRGGSGIVETPAPDATATASAVASASAAPATSSH